jgi:hypothetical protein
MSIEKIKIDKQKAFLTKLFEQVQLDEEEQITQAITLLPAALEAIHELKETNRYLCKELLNKEVHLKEVLQQSLSAQEVTLKQSEEATETLKAYIQLQDTAVDNLQIYKTNEGVLLSEMTRVKTIKRSEFASETGGKKNHEVRNKAYTFLRQCITNEPKLSINRLAMKLVDESTKNKDRFGRFIPMSTAKDYTRFIKKEVESSTQQLESSTQQLESSTQSNK